MHHHLSTNASNLIHIAMSFKPTIVLVPGAWATPAFYTQLSSNLSEKGLITETVAHSSSGTEPPTKTLDDDVSNLRSTLQRLVNSGECHRGRALVRRACCLWGGSGSRGTSPSKGRKAGWCGDDRVHDRVRG